MFIQMLSIIWSNSYIHKVWHSRWPSASWIRKGNANGGEKNISRFTRSHSSFKSPSLNMTSSLIVQQMLRMKIEVHIKKEDTVNRNKKADENVNKIITRRSLYFTETYLSRSLHKRIKYKYWYSTSMCTDTLCLDISTFVNMVK